MKKLLAYILLATLAYLSVGGLFSCRSLLTTRDRGDSTATVSERNERKFDREIITEYVPFYGDTLWLTRLDTLWRTQMQTIQVPWPYAVPGPERIIRQTIRESGQSVQSRDTDTALKSDSKQKDLQTPILNQITMLLWALIGLIVVGLAVFFIFGRRKS